MRYLKSLDRLSRESITKNAAAAAAAKSLQSCPTLSDPMAPPSMGFSRQEYWSGVSLPSPNLRIDNYSKGKKKNGVNSWN